MLRYSHSSPHSLSIVLLGIATQMISPGTISDLDVSTPEHELHTTWNSDFMHFIRMLKLTATIPHFITKHYHISFDRPLFNVLSARVKKANFGIKRI